MKKLIFIVMGLFVIYYFYNIWKQDLGNGYKYVDNGYDYWQSIFNNEDEVIPVKVIEYNHNKRFIIAVRIVFEIYDCYNKNVKDLTETSVSYHDTINQKKLQYWLIDKEKEIAYVSEKKIKIEEKIKSLNVSLSFENKDYTDNIYMKGFKDKLNLEDICMLTNNPFKDNIFSSIVNMDKI